MNKDKITTESDEQIKIDYTVSDISGYFGWSSVRQAEICKILGIERLYGKKDDRRIQFGYLADAMPKFIDFAGMVPVIRDGKKYLVRKDSLREKLK